MLDRATLRTQLRNVNIEYSALLKSEVHGRSKRMAQLRADRRQLMALLDDGRLRPHSDRPILHVAQRQSA